MVESAFQIGSLAWKMSLRCEMVRLTTHENTTRRRALVGAFEHAYARTRVLEYFEHLVLSTKKVLGTCCFHRLLGTRLLTAQSSNEW